MLTASGFQPESSCQFFAVRALIWKGLGSWLVLRLRRTSALISRQSVSSSVPLGRTRQFGDGTDAAKGGFEAAVFGGEGADGNAVAVGQRVEGELVGNAVVAADELAEFEFVGGHGGGGQLVVQGKVERHALFQRLLQRVGQFGVETAADVEAAVCSYGCGLAGDGNVFRRRFRRPQQYHGKQQDGRRRTGGADDAAVCGFTAVCG